MSNTPKQHLLRHTAVGLERVAEHRDDYVYQNSGGNGTREGTQADPLGMAPFCT